MRTYMSHAINEAKCGLDEGHGGPFGAVIVKNGNIISSAHNEVLKNNDPTAHAEIQAIRKASQILSSFDLSGCEIYTTCEPCPMCFAAIHWARIDKVFFGCNREDADKIGFRDHELYQALSGEKELIESLNVNREECLELFRIWEDKEDKITY